jgi:hypothetical protein
MSISRKFGWIGFAVSLVVVYFFVIYMRSNLDSGGMMSPLGLPILVIIITVVFHWIGKIVEKKKNK